MFFLLASFMMVSLSQTHMKGIRVNLPAAVAPPQNQPKDYVAIKVAEGDAVYFDSQFVPDDQVLPRLYQLHAANPDIKVSISASMLAMHGDVIASSRQSALGGDNESRLSDQSGSRSGCARRPALHRLPSLNRRAELPVIRRETRESLGPVADSVFQFVGNSPNVLSKPFGRKIGS